MSRIRWYGPAVVLVLAVLMVMLVGPGVVRHLDWVHQDERIRLVKSDLAGNASLAELSNAFRQVSKAVEPSVVAIQVSARHIPGREGQMMSPEDQLRRFFGPRGMPMPNEDQDDDDEAPQPGRRQPQPQEDNRYSVPQPYGSGSGWVYDKEGHIITNNHVVSGADLITVRFNDGSERTATLVAADLKTDIAVIKVEGGNLHPASRMDLVKNPVEQGDIVFAFGSPFRFEFSMSQGIVSAKGRQLGIIHDTNGIGGYENFIQTDAAINPGNSGGPLTNIYGEVVGMNTAIASRTGAYNGLGFAIPVDMVEDVVGQILKSGKVSRGFIGIQLNNDQSPRMLKSYGFEGSGVLVAQTLEDQPAAKAGIKANDIITKVNGNSVATVEDLRRRIALIKPGEKVAIEYFRGGERHTTDIAVVEQPSEVVRGMGGVPTQALTPKKMETLNKLGIESVSEFTPELAARLKLKFTPGVIVRRVDTDSEAASKGITAGAVITDVMGVAVKTPEDLVKELDKSDVTKGVRLGVIENGVSGLVLLELPK